MLDVKVLIRFMAKTKLPKGSGGCLEWTGSKTAKGYGQIYLDGKQAMAHRVAHELFIGPIPKGLEIDHLCFNKSCVNPHHIEAVTRSENNRRAKRGMCKRGHLYRLGSYVIKKNKSGPSRYCRECRKIHAANWRKSRRRRGLPTVVRAK